MREAVVEAKEIQGTTIYSDRGVELEEAPLAEQISALAHSVLPHASVSAHYARSMNVSQCVVFAWRVRPRRRTSWARRSWIVVLIWRRRPIHSK